MGIRMRYVKGFIFAWIASCTPSAELPESQVADPQAEQVYIPTPTDTILEENNPEKLDLSKAQLFQDTTRNSLFYQQLIDWTPRIYHQESVKLYVEKLRKGYRPKVKSLKKFPKIFISLRKFQNEFFLYDRCDGIDPRFEIKEGLFLKYGFWEVDPKAIETIVKESSQELELMVWDNAWEETSKTARVSIKKSAIAHVYSLTYHTDSFQRKEWVTPLNHVSSFDLIVNHCPKEKMSEYAGFESK